MLQLKKTSFGLRKTVLRNVPALRQAVVLKSINQVRQGRVRDLEEVCDRLEKKYTDEEI